MNGERPRLPRGPGRQFAKGESGNPAGRRSGSRNKATLAAADLLAGEADALTRKAIEKALEGDPLALRLCLERVVPRARERAVSFHLPPIIGPDRAEDDGGPSTRELSLALNAVTAALAAGEITPAEAATVATVVERFVHAIAMSKRDGLSYGQVRALLAEEDDDGYDDDADDGYDDDAEEGYDDGAEEGYDDGDEDGDDRH